MADVLIKVDEAVIPGIANAIMNKTGKFDPLSLPQFAEEIEGISVGSGDGDIQSVDGVSFQASTSSSSLSYTYQCYEITSGTTLSGTIQAVAGEWVLATVTTRSATTFPEDWTLLHEGNSLGSNANDQRMHFLCKQVESDGEISIDISQASAGRIYINLVAVRGCNGFAYSEGSEQLFTTQSNSFRVKKQSHGVSLWGCSANLWNTSVPYGLWSCTQISDPPIALDDTVTMPRQANFFDTNELIFYTFSAPASTCAIIDCVEVLIDDGEDDEDDKTYYKVDAEWFSEIVGFLSDIVPENGMTTDQMHVAIKGLSRGGNSALLTSFPVYTVFQKGSVYYVIFHTSFSVGTHSTDGYSNDRLLNACYIYGFETLQEVYKLIWDKWYFEQVTPVAEPMGENGGVIFDTYTDTRVSLYANINSSNATWRFTISKNYAKLPLE